MHKIAYRITIHVDEDIDIDQTRWFYDDTGGIDYDNWYTQDMYMEEFTGCKTSYYIQVDV